MLKLASFTLASALVGSSARLWGGGQVQRRVPRSLTPRREQALTILPLAEAGQAARLNARDCLKVRLRYWRSAAAARVLHRRVTLPLTFEQKIAYVALLDAPWFDGKWYLAENPDVARASIEPLHHLVKHGLLEGRAPFRGAASKPAKPADEPPPQGLEAYRHSVENALPRPRLVPPPEREPLDKGHLKGFSDGAVATAMARFSRFPLYRDDDYFMLNEPLRREPGLCGYRHALTYGFSEGRRVFSRQTIANELGLRSRDVDSRGLEIDAAPVDPLSVSVVYNKSGNSFLREIAECLAFDLEAAGHDVELLHESSDPSCARAHTLIVGPHEFFFLGNGKHWIREDILSRAILYNTEQPQTIWFDRAVPFNMLARGALDLSPQLASIYGESLPALCCDPLGAPLEDRLPDESDAFLRVLPGPARRLGSRKSALSSRSIDVSFFGAISPHRERFFSRTARFFADLQTVIYCRRKETVLRADGGVDLLEAARHVGFHSKIVLNIHRDEFGFFEWHRIVRLGLATGAVVVSEPCLPHPVLKPNVHYFEESGRHIQNLVDWLLRTPDGRAAYDAVRANASAYIDAQHDSAASGRRIAKFMAETPRRES